MGSSATAHVGSDGKDAARPSGPAQQFPRHSQSGRDSTQHILGGFTQVVLVPGLEQLA